MQKPVRAYPWMTLRNKPADAVAVTERYKGRRETVPGTVIVQRNNRLKRRKLDGTLR